MSLRRRIQSKAEANDEGVEAEAEVAVRDVQDRALHLALTPHHQANSQNDRGKLSH